jgi:hypothetical protein
MGYNTKKLEGGQGGKKGHSQMSHWTGTEEIKVETKKGRRAEDKRLEREAKYESFLDGLKGYEKDELIEAVKSGFRVCIEADEAEGTNVSGGDGGEEKIDIQEEPGTDISIKGNVIHEEFTARFPLGDHIAKLDDIKKIMNKYGLDLNYKITLLESKQIPDTEKTIYKYALDLTYTAPEFKRDGYEYVLTVQKTNQGNFVFPTPEHKDEDFSKYYSGTFICDHCHVDRLRNTYHIFRKEGKDYVYGTKCAKEYFGISFLDKISVEIMSLISFLQGIRDEIGEEREEEFYGGGGKYSLSVDMIFSVSWLYFTDQLLSVE